jgi:SAM-dependent methyltransferase
MASASVRDHWDEVWTAKDPHGVSWFEPSPRVSLELLESLSLPLAAPIIDVGGGASGLAGALVRRGYEDVTVADISEAAVAQARSDLGARAESVTWVVGDARSHDFGRRYAVWHDRALFHFLVDADDRRRYLETLRRSLAHEGHVIIATFGPEGPTSCSGLPTVRYSATDLGEALAPVARLVSAQLEIHMTPTGRAQQFLFAHLQSG